MNVKEIYRIYGYLWGHHGPAGNRLINPFKLGISYQNSQNSVDGTPCEDSNTGFTLDGPDFKPGFFDEKLKIPTKVTAACLGTDNSITGGVRKGGTGFTLAHWRTSY